MASIKNGNTFYIDQTSASGSLNTFVSGNSRLKSITLTGDTAGDNVILNDKTAGTAHTAGALKISVKTGTANDTMYLDFSHNPVVFPNGIWVSTLSAGTVATVVYEQISG